MCIHCLIINDIIRTYIIRLTEDVSLVSGLPSKGKISTIYVLLVRFVFKTYNFNVNFIEDCLDFGCTTRKNLFRISNESADVGRVKVKVRSRLLITISFWFRSTFKIHIQLFWFLPIYFSRLIKTLTKAPFPKNINYHAFVTNFMYHQIFIILKVPPITNILLSILILRQHSSPILLQTVPKINLKHVELLFFRFKIINTPLAPKNFIGLLQLMTFNDTQLLKI